MNLPSSLKEVQALCEESGLKYKGKTKNALKTLLIDSAVETVDDSENDDDDISDIETKKLKDLKLICEKKGLSKVGCKSELIKRITALTENRDNGIPVIQWRKRGRKPQEAVDIAASEDVPEMENPPKSTYSGLKKYELRQICVRRNIPASGTIPVLVKRLLENDSVNKQIEADQNRLTPVQMCESCDNNPDKIHATPIAKWYCQDCDQKICNLCKDAHKKIQMIRTHVICPFGTNLDFNINEDESFVINFPPINASKPLTKKRFMDIILDTPKVA